MSQAVNQSPESYRHPSVHVRLDVRSGPHAGMAVVWTSGRHVIGRGAGSSLALPHDLVASTDHCCLEIDERGCRIQDLGSRSGTQLNGKIVKISDLRSGDQLRIGMSDLLDLLEI